MKIEVTRVEASDVTPLRELYRQEMNCQIVHDSYLRRGFAHPYLIGMEGSVMGYGLVGSDTVDEFYTFPDYRAAALPLFRQLLETTQATYIRAQTNDRLMLLMLYDCAAKVTTDTILFADAFTSRLPCPDGVLRPTTDADRGRMFEHKSEPVGDWMVECDGIPVATGGALFHYNPPYGDLYMEVHPDYRQRGFGSYLIQELKRITYEGGKIPAARCNASNAASRNTLQKAGLLPCARILIGEVAK
jgi:GNAT superfamily N-acetyltransferase